jgi:hypothetical protein
MAKRKSLFKKKFCTKVSKPSEVSVEDYKPGQLAMQKKLIKNSHP